MTSRLVPDWLLLSLLVVAPVNAEQFESSKQQAVLIELFTSQGCNSCPPAEEYLNSFKSHDGLWKTYIPLAFHVDYWDYLGWKDRFASPAHRVKQEAYARLNKQNTIYTPGFYVNGKPWRQGFLNRDPQPTTQQSGVLSVSLNQSHINATFQPATLLSEELVLHVALLGMNLQTRIGAGENAGRHSGHEFVVLHHQTATSREQRWQFNLHKTSFNETDKLALAAWVTRKSNPRPIQAVGGYLAVP